jgi:hypothetical protein
MGGNVSTCSSDCAADQAVVCDSTACRVDYGNPAQPVFAALDDAVCGCMDGGDACFEPCRLFVELPGHVVTDGVAMDARAADSASDCVAFCNTHSACTAVSYDPSAANGAECTPCTSVTHIDTSSTVGATVLFDSAAYVADDSRA